MNNRRLLKAISMSLMLVVLVSAVASCGDSSDTEDSPYKLVTTVPETEPVTEEESLPPDDADINVLWKKKIAVIGDEVSKSDNAMNSYVRYVAKRNGMSYQNFASEGGTFSDASDFRIWYNIKFLQNDASFIIVQGGFNDYDKKVPLGTITSTIPSKVDDTTFDTKTLAGGLERACWELVTRFPEKTYGFVFTHRYYDYGSDYDTKWRPLMKEILNKWGVPYIDLQEELPAYNHIDSLREKYTLDGEGRVPNVLCAKECYAPRVEAWLKSIVSGASESDETQAAETGPVNNAVTTQAPPEDTAS